MPLENLYIGHARHDTASGDGKNYLALRPGELVVAVRARNTPGLRVTLVQNYMRTYMRPQHMHDRDVSPQLRQKYPDLDRVLAGVHQGMIGDIFQQGAVGLHICCRLTHKFSSPSTLNSESAPA